MVEFDENLNGERIGRVDYADGIHIVWELRNLIKEVCSRIFSAAMLYACLMNSALYEGVSLDAVTDDIHAWFVAACGALADIAICVRCAMSGVYMYRQRSSSRSAC